MQTILRIIGGKWRSRKITFTPKTGLRPTTDTTRETLFNWLAPRIGGAQCLDLFAGSGALGFEALSRGAAQAVMVDCCPQVVRQLRTTATALATDAALIFQAKIPTQSSRLPLQPYDIIFLDPPFRQQWLPPTCAWLAASALLAPNAWIFLECERELDLASVIPPTWQVLRCRNTRQAQSCLLSCENFPSQNAGSDLL